MNITLLYGTETGNAEMLAEDIAASLEAEHEVDCRNLSDFGAIEFDPERLYVIVCSTYGEGDLPASARPFAEALQSASPSLDGIHFAIFGLGDSEYDDTFNHGSNRLAELLSAHGAMQLGERLTHDASSGDMAEDIALPWAGEIIAMADRKLSEAA